MVKPNLSKFLGIQFYNRYSSLTDQDEYLRVTKVRSRDYDIMNFAPHKVGD